MCGITGQFLTGRDPKTPPVDFHALIGLMTRRGPDDEGLWSDGERCWLGFRRLAILDLSPTGHQPMVTPDGRFALVMNGEVYNYRELRASLEQCGVRFRSSGDAEVVLNALACEGTAALARFNGMFAVAFYDRQEKRLLLARDRVGIKPLYVLPVPEGLLFASQYDQMLAHPWCRELPISEVGRGIYFRLGYIPAPYALHQGVEMLAPGSWIEVDAGGQIRRGRFYDFPKYQQPDLAGAEACEAVNAVVSAAVRRQMVSDVPVGSFLSGGIDSPLVTARMRAATNQQIPAFTIGTNGGLEDESQQAAAYARELGVVHYLQQANPSGALALLEDVVSACGEPFADYSIFPTLMVSQLARQQVKVMLSGDGGDELFWGYPGRFGSAIAYAKYFRYPQWARKVLWAGLRFGSNAGRLWSVQHFNSAGDWYRGHHSHLGEGWVRQIFPDLGTWPQECGLYSYNDHRADVTAQWVRWNEFYGHLGMVLMKVDRGSMYHSLEVRVPLLDNEVIDTAARIDWRACLDLNTGMGKIPLRKALARDVSIPAAGKRGFSVPMGEWLRGPLKPLFEEKVLARQSLLGLPFHRPTLARLYDMHQRHNQDYAWGLWILLSAALWEDRYLRR